MVVTRKDESRELLQIISQIKRYNLFEFTFMFIPCILKSKLFIIYQYMHK